MSQQVMVEVDIDFKEWNIGFVWKKSSTIPHYVCSKLQCNDIDMIIFKKSIDWIF